MTPYFERLSKSGMSETADVIKRMAGLLDLLVVISEQPENTELLKTIYATPGGAYAPVSLVSEARTALSKLDALQ